MWNETGDPNGRHNLPGRACSTRCTAALLPWGWRWPSRWPGGAGAGRRATWPYLLPAVGLVALLAGGVLSSPDESPQALRTLGDSSMVALLAALPLASLWRALGDLGGRLWRARPATWPGPAALGGAGWQSC